MLNGFWGIVASPEASVFVGVIVLVVLVRLGYHRTIEGIITRRRLASVFGLTASTYTFGVCAIAQLLVHGPTVAQLVEHGFGNERVAWLLSILILDQGFRIWDEFRPMHDQFPKG